MGTKAGWGITVLGALLALLGLTMMVVLGPDSRVTSGPHHVDTDGIAVVTAPKAITWTGVQVSVLAELPANKPVFVGLGNAVDVNDYVKDTERLEVDEFHTPWKVHTRTVKGRENLPAAPTALDWWLAASAGIGGASIDTTLPDQTVSLAVLSVGSSSLKGLKVTTAYGVKGGFAKGGGLVLFGLGGIWLGTVLRRGKELWREEEDREGANEDEDDLGDEEFDDVVYVYIDEKGVEHEISADDAADYDVEDVVVEEYVIDADTGDEVGELPEPDLEPEPQPNTEPEPEPEPEPKPAPAAGEERVRYVFVDEVGVEHEVDEDELTDYEIVDDEEDRP
ncbi:MAG: hypothetical protein ACXWXJ_00275 [Aeromicrobium sp.]